MPETAKRVTERRIELFPADIRSCGSCGARVVWAITTNGKKMPVDERPTRDGNVLLIRKERNIQAQVLGPLDVIALREGLELRLPHFATCPHAAEHRRR